MKERTLKYYKSSEDIKHPQGVFNFDQFKYTIELVDSSAWDFFIKIEGIPDRKFEFRASSTHECIDWYEEIKNHIEASQGFKFQKTAASLLKPWKFDTISEQ